MEHHPVATASRDQRPAAPAKPKLPSIAAKRLAYLETEIDLLHGQMESIRERLKRAQNSSALDPNDEASVEIARNLTAKRMEVRGRIDGLAKLMNEANEWLPRAMRLGPLTDARPKGRIPQGEDDLKQAIGTLRSEITTTKILLGETQRAGVAPVNLEGQVRQYVATIAQKGRPQTVSVGSDGKVDLDFKSWDVPPSAHALLAWLDPQALTKRLVAEIQERQANGGREVLTAEQRAERIAELTAKLDAAERREVLLVETAIDRDIGGYAFRPDTSIAAFLGVRATREPQRRT
jgi:hypothetical protein